MIRYSGVKPFTRHTLRGEPFTMYREEPSAVRYDDRLLDCSVYLYPNEDYAQRGERIGGSGFLVAMPGFDDSWLLEGQCPRSDLYHLYVVSCRHLIRHPDVKFIPSPVVRLNTHGGNIDVIPAQIGDWECSEDDDVAVLPIPYRSYFKYLSVPTSRLLTKETAQAHDVGIGDEVFMVGRFVSHDGRQKNQPSLRFGHVSMMPGDSIYHPSNTSGEQESFLVEVHAIPGYSGSPVFVRPALTPKFTVATGVNNVVTTDFIGGPMDVPLGGGPWLLGVEWGYIGSHDQGLNNTGVCGVVPAWRLLRLLNTDHLVEQRRQEQEQERKQAEQSRVVLTDRS
jgi:hypothetical protein